MSAIPPRYFHRPGDFGRCLGEANFPEWNTTAVLPASRLRRRYESPANLPARLISASRRRYLSPRRSTRTANLKPLPPSLRPQYGGKRQALFLVGFLRALCRLPLGRHPFLLYTLLHAARVVTPYRAVIEVRAYRYLVSKLKVQDCLSGPRYVVTAVERELNEGEMS